MPWFFTIQSLVNHVATPERENVPHFNQATYTPLEYTLIAVLMALQTLMSTSVCDSLVQLGLWTASWHERMLYLCEYLYWSSSSAPPRMVPLPLIQVLVWHMYFPCDKVNDIAIYGPVSLGSTKSQVDLYALFTRLRFVNSYGFTVRRQSFSEDITFILP
ncbi:hypothetical protein F4808DRAFT_287724 [Astrocystis sublimbata]|nr:hypothetical protein F4808DRAFT_287724 [Astrocystis sublimbata]